MDDAPETRTESPPNAWVAGGVLVALGLVAYAGVAWLLSSAAQSRTTVSEARPALAVPFGPDRVPLETLQLHKAGFAYDCDECHYDRVRDRTPRTFVGEHSKLNFDHGRNDRCFNCHHETELTSFVTAAGDVLPSTDHVKLCAGCHGTQHRDWLGGAHGRRSGFWDRSVGALRRTDCIVCHDPHRPAFRPIEPLPPPGVAVGPVHPPLEPHGAVQQILRTPPVVEPDTLRGPAPAPDEDAP
ncbi:MAG: hypothetical protein KC583_24080 [Myxococcales bacterium]|nr:hypothetical protein [Myxococcales bacterium]